MKNSKNQQQEEATNITELIWALQKADEEQKHMTEEEKRNNAIKMGDIWY